MTTARVLPSAVFGVKLTVALSECHQVVLPGSTQDPGEGPWKSSPHPPAALKDDPQSRIRQKTLGRPTHYATAAWCAACLLITSF